MFGKKKEKEPTGEEEAAEAPAEQKAADRPAGTLTLAQLSADLDRLSAQFSSFYEMQKAATERFSRINEQIGELRAMLIERDRAAQHMEAKATQAIDLVETIQPEKLMIEVRKSDAKTEALKAGLESHEAVMNSVVAELKETRAKLTAFKGMEEVVKLNDEVKKELSQIKLIQSVVERHADKVDTIFAEMQKAFGEYIKLSDMLKSFDQASKQLTADTDNIKVTLKEVAMKKEVAVVSGRVEEFEKKVSSVLTLMNEKFSTLEKKANDKIDAQLAKSAQLLKGFETLAKKVPDLDNYFNLLSEEAKKAAKEAQEGATVEKIKQPGEEEDPMKEAEQKADEKKGKGLKLPGLFGKKK